MAIALHVMLVDERPQNSSRADHIVLRFERIDDAVLEELAGVVNDGDFTACPKPGIDAQERPPARPGGQQQVLEVLTKDADRLFVGALLQFEAYLGLQRRIQQPVPRVFDRLFQMRGPFAGFASTTLRRRYRAPDFGRARSRRFRIPSFAPRRIASIRCEGIVFAGSRKSAYIANLLLGSGDALDGPADDHALLRHHGAQGLCGTPRFH